MEAVQCFFGTGFVFDSDSLLLQWDMQNHEAKPKGKQAYQQIDVSKSLFELVLPTADNHWRDSEKAIRSQQVYVLLQQHTT